MNTKAILLGILILCMGVYAYSADISGSCSGTSTQCEISLNNLELCNDSLNTETYNSYFNGEYASWFNVVPGKVTLQPQECVQLKVYTIANCYADPGMYYANLVVQNGETLSVQCSVDLTQGHYVDIEVEPTVQEATQCEEKIYDLTVSNNTTVPNQQIERIDLSIDGIPNEWYTLEEERILVERGNPEIVKLFVQAPCDADFGDYSFTAKATLPNPEFFDEADGEYILDQGQGIQIILGEEFDGSNAEACLEVPTSASFRLINNGKLSDNLKISLEGPSFATIDKTSASLDEGEEEVITINFNKTSEEIGEYDFTLKVESTLFEYATSKTFSLDLRDCYNLEVKKLKGEANVCVEDKPLYQFSLKNNHSRTVEVDASIEGVPSDLDAVSFSIEPGQTVELNTVIDVSELAKEARVSKNDLAVELIIDASGSMVEKIKGKNKMEVAKTSIINLVNNINEINLGLRVLGQGELCEDSTLLVPVEKLNISKITGEVASLKPMGKTPIAQALDASINDFPTGKQKAIILVSDGKETCGGNISETAKKLAQENIVVYSIGFDIDADGKEQLEEIASRTKGKYFEAKNPEELVEVLQKISQELDIVPSKEGKETFTLKLESEFFSFEKDYSIVVSDCYNATMVAPELNLCNGVEKSDVLTLVNLGSEAQEFTLDFTVDWIKAKNKVTVEANSEEVIPLVVLAPNTETDKYSIKAVSGTVELEQEKNINYLSNASCFGIDLIVLEGTLEAESCMGKKQSIVIENRGVVDQEVSLIVDQKYVELVDDKVLVKAGEKVVVDFFVSPPFDLPETTFIKISAVSDRGFKTSVQIKLVVTENQDSFGLGEVDVRINDLNIANIEGLEHDVELKFSLYNDSNRTLEVFNATTLDFNAVVQIEDRFISAKKTVEARILLDLPEDAREGEITVPIKLETDEGTYTRNIVFSYVPSEEEIVTGVEDQVSVGTGLFSLANLSTAILGGLIVIVLALILYSAYVATRTEEEPKKPSESEKETKAVKEKLAELKKKKTAKKKTVKKKTKKK